MLNKMQGIGNLGAKPDIRQAQNGNKIANFTVALTEKWKDRQTGERREKTEWARVVCFQPGLVGVIEQYLDKGSKIYFAGKLSTRKWTGQDGRDNWTTEVVLEDLQMLDPPRQQQGGYGAQQSAPQGGGGGYPQQGGQGQQGQPQGRQEPQYGDRGYGGQPQHPQDGGQVPLDDDIPF